MFLSCTKVSASYIHKPLVTSDTEKYKARISISSSKQKWRQLKTEILLLTDPTIARINTTCNQRMRTYSLRQRY
jgi:hypothetical protein